MNLKRSSFLLLTLFFIKSDQLSPIKITFRTSEYFCPHCHKRLCRTQTQSPPLKVGRHLVKIITILGWSILGNLTILPVNESDFLVPKSGEPGAVHHLRIVNGTFFVLEEPFLDIDFAEFRENGLYIKVKFSQKIESNNSFPRIILHAHHYFDWSLKNIHRHEKWRLYFCLRSIPVDPDVVC